MPDEPADEIRFLYATAPDRAVAEAVAEALLAARLAACVNVFPDMTSLYRWNGAVRRDAEVAMIVKTTAGLAAAARDAILAAHPYDTPAIASLVIEPEGSHGAFLDWIRAETHKTASP